MEERVESGERSYLWVPEDRTENATVKTDYCRMTVEVWEMKKLSDAVWAKEDGVIYLCRTLGNINNWMKKKKAPDQKCL